MPRPPCPYLPLPESAMSYRCLSELRGGDVSTFYVVALRYGQQLWLEGHAGRSILAITRALYADLDESAAALRDWPLPYRALRWIVSEHPDRDFPGNPRISFQHQASRLRGERKELRRARAWAVWALIRAARPELPGDAVQEVEEPAMAQIEASLQQHGHSNEAVLWSDALRA